MKNGGTRFWILLDTYFFFSWPVSWCQRDGWVCGTMTSTLRNGWKKTPTTTTTTTGSQREPSCSSRSESRTMTICRSRKRNAVGGGSWRRRRTWPADRSTTRRRRPLSSRRPTRTCRRCRTRNAMPSRRWPPTVPPTTDHCRRPTVPAWTAACAGTSTPTDVPRVSRTPARCPTWTRGRKNAEARRAGNNSRWTSKSYPCGPKKNKIKKSQESKPRLKNVRPRSRTKIDISFSDTQYIYFGIMRR